MVHLNPPPDMRTKVPCTLWHAGFSFPFRGQRYQSHESRKWYVTHDVAGGTARLSLSWRFKVQFFDSFSRKIRYRSDENFVQVVTIVTGIMFLIDLQIIMSGCCSIFKQNWEFLKTNRVFSIPNWKFPYIHHRSDKNLKISLHTLLVWQKICIVPICIIFLIGLQMTISSHYRISKLNWEFLKPNWVVSISNKNFPKPNSEFSI